MRFAVVLLFVSLVVSCNNSVQAPGRPTDANALLTNPEFQLKHQSLYRVGNIVSAYRLRSESEEDIRWRQLLLAQHNSITAENDMKMARMFPQPYTVNFSLADSIVAFAIKHDLRIHGHALVWHGSVPGWLHAPEIGDSAFREHIKWYVDTTVRHFAQYRDNYGLPVVRSWDVVNEYFVENSIRQSVFVQRMGEQFIDSVFHWARQASTDVKLFYNDYNLAGEPNKRSQVLRMVERFEFNGIPIDGIGLQMHVYSDWPKLDIPIALREVAATGLLVHVSELDVRSTNVSNFSSGVRVDEPRQAHMYRNIVHSYTSIVPVSQQFGLTFWGLRDTDSWIYQQGHNYPSLFTHDFTPKSAFFAVLDALKH